MSVIVEIMPKRGFDGSRSTRSNKNLVAILAYEGVNAFELGMAVEVFGLPNMGRNWYNVIVCAEQTGVPLAAGGGVKIVACAGLASLREANTIIVPGWQDIDATPSDGLLDALRHAYARGIRIASICSGIFVLAAAGLLEGRRVAAHWAQAGALARKYPLLRVDPNVLYVDDGDILSSAGRAAGLDLCVHIVRKDFGPGIANDVARRLVIPAHREGGQAQFILRPVWTEDSALVDLRAWIGEHLDCDLTIDQLAAKARMSRRTFIRRFKAATGVTPGEWILQERTALARSLLEASTMTVEQVATVAGFSSADALRHHFRKRYETSPNRYRVGFRT
jgi:AraC family transcriptional regulator, transcriptional activator FtrA